MCRKPNCSATMLRKRGQSRAKLHPRWLRDYPHSAPSHWNISHPVSRQGIKVFSSRLLQFISDYILVFSYPHFYCIAAQNYSKLLDWEARPARCAAADRIQKSIRFGQDLVGVEPRSGELRAMEIRVFIRRAFA